jgi:hypothetical protein
MKYAVMFEPFPMEGFEYVCRTDGKTWYTNGNPKVFDTKKEAEIEANKWNTGVVVNMEENIK